VGKFLAREYTGSAREVWRRVSESAGSAWWLVSLLATAACLPVWYLLRPVHSAFAVVLSTALLVAVCTPIGMLLAIALKQVSVALSRAGDTHVQLALERPDTLWALSVLGYVLGAVLGLGLGLWLFL
jgi:carbon starvation protein CstA